MGSGGGSVGSGGCVWGVVDIMRVNVDKVLERDQKLSELDDRADALQAGASQFETSAAKLKRKYWWKNLKVGAASPKPAPNHWKVAQNMPNPP
uniref:V-SNARE coiled-coil homology domain-containing protein n=1 Tax=Calidris pygmaea TaxID=425635 RepID=A0A8C3KF47_9CHAR